MKYIDLTFKEALANQEVLYKQGKFFNIHVETKRPRSYYLLPSHPKSYIAHGAIVYEFRSNTINR